MFLVKSLHLFHGFKKLFEKGEGEEINISETHSALRASRLSLLTCRSRNFCFVSSFVTSDTETLWISSCHFYVTRFLLSREQKYESPVFSISLLILTFSLHLSEQYFFFFKVIFLGPLPHWCYHFHFLFLKVLCHQLTDMHQSLAFSAQAAFLLQLKKQ